MRCAFRSCAAQKRTQENINARLALVMKSGKYTLGLKTCLKTLRSGKGASWAHPLKRVWGGPVACAVRASGLC